jgi:Zn-finger nucleic acid-binding protein
MRCPLDKKDMIVVEHQKIELDYCLQCSGVWVDASELELLLEALKRQGAQIKQNDLLSPRQAVVNEVTRKCPHCSAKMEKVWMGKEPQVVIDSCPRGHGLWFDGGELHQILCQLEPVDKKGSKDVISFLGDTFKADCNK